MRKRILLTIVLITLAAVAAFFVPAGLAVRSSTRRGDSLDLERDAAIVASHIPSAGTVEVAELQQLVGPDRQLAFYDAQGFIGGLGPTEPDEFVEVALAGRFAEGWSNGDLVAAVPVRRGLSITPLVVRIDEPGSVSQHRIERKLLLLGLIGAVIVAVAIGIGVLLTRRLARPIEDLTKWAGRPDEHANPPGRTGIGEIDELRSALIDGRIRVDEALQRERAFSSHVSHQLRTPVAALRAALETELTAPRPDPKALLHEGLGAVDRLEATITSLLALARKDDRRAERCDVVAVVTDQIDRWRPMLAERGRGVDVDGTSMIATIDPATVRHILDVLLENASSHGSGTIDVRVRARVRDVSGSAPPETADLVIEVSDGGSLPAGADPFTERLADTGRGIGLRLARTLAESAGGGLVLANCSPTTFRLQLPVGLGATGDALTDGDPSGAHRAD